MLSKPIEPHDQYFGVTIILVISSLLVGVAESSMPLIYTYLDDNVKKSKAPMMMTFFSFVGEFYPLISMLASYFFLKIYVDPTLHPVFDDTDPRWLGAWWMGWFFFAGVALIFVPLIGRFKIGFSIQATVIKYSR